MSASTADRNPTRVLDATSAPTLPELLEQLHRLEQLASSANSGAIDTPRVQALVQDITSRVPPLSSPSLLSELFADAGYDILHSLLPLVSPDSLQHSAALRDAADSVLTCTVLYGSPREVFLPLLSHLSAHITPLAQQQEEKSEEKQNQPPAVEPQPSQPYVSFLLPYFVCLLQRENHAARHASMFRSLTSLLAAFFAAMPTDEALSALLSPLQPVLRSDNDAHVGFLLSLLASYLPPHHPQPAQPSPALFSLLSTLPDSSTSATFTLAALTTYLRTRHSLTEQLSAMRQQSWELTEDEEQLTRAQRDSWHAAATADDEDQDEDEEEQDERERQRRGELRQTKAQLAALPPFPLIGVVCFVLVQLSSDNQRQVEQLLTGEMGGVVGLRVYVDAMLGTDLAGQHRQLMVDFMHRWLSLLPPHRLPYTPVLSTGGVEEQTRDDSWMLAECITTLMMQPPQSHLSAHPIGSTPSTTVNSASASSLLLLYLSRFTSAARLSLTASLIPACPFPPIQAILVSTLKDLLRTSDADEQPPVSAVVDLLLSLLQHWSDASSALERVDGLMAVLNVLRFVVLHRGAGRQQLSDDKRKQVVAAVRLMQQRVRQAEEGESGREQQKAADLPLLMLKDLTARVLELS